MRFTFPLWCSRGAGGQRPFFETMARPIRTDFDLQGPNRSGRVDWGLPQLQIADF